MSLPHREKQEQGAELSYSAPLSLPQVTIKKRMGMGSLGFFDYSVRILVSMAALFTIGITIGIVFYLFYELDGFFEHVSLWEFVTGTRWTPLLGETRSYGILPLVSGTMLIAVGSSLVAVPLGLAAALYLSEYVSPRPRSFLKSTLEVLAGIPTVVYGFLALTFITPHLKTVFPDLQIFNALSAIIVVGIMIVPTVASVSEDAFRAVPRALREAGYGIGGRKYQVALTVVLPAALSGVVASVILGFSRALGETMAVTLAAGATPRLGINIFDSVQTMTAYIAQVSQGDVPVGTIEYQTIFAVGLALFVMTLFCNLIAQYFVTRWVQRY